MTDYKSINVFSFTRFLSVMMGIVGLICGIIYAIGGFFVDVLVSLNILSAVAMSTPGLSWGTVLALGALLAMPLIGLATGLIAGITLSLLYNLLARWLSWVPINFEKKQ